MSISFCKNKDGVLFLKFCLGNILGSVVNVMLVILSEAKNLVYEWQYVSEKRDSSFQSE
jgi:membrane protein YqaA with SNARE-associated domain